MGVMRRFLVIADVVVFGGLPVMSGRIRMVFGGLPMMFRSFLGHNFTSFCILRLVLISPLWTRGRSR
jgi:hypothetical protein